MDKQNAGNTVLTALKIINNNFDIETTEEDQVVKAVKTRQSAESKIATNTWAYIFKYKFENVKEYTDEVAEST